jgi:hypothetical protein
MTDPMHNDRDLQKLRTCGRMGLGPGSATSRPLAVSIGRAHSDNGMIRPCSDLDSKKSWQGERQQ